MTDGLYSWPQLSQIRHHKNESELGTFEGALLSKVAHIQSNDRLYNSWGIPNHEVTTVPLVVVLATLKKNILLTRELLPRQSPDTL